MESIERRPIRILLLLGGLIVLAGLLFVYRSYNKNTIVEPEEDNATNVVAEDLSQTNVGEEAAADTTNNSDVVIVNIPQPTLPRYKGNPVGTVKIDPAIAAQISAAKVKQYTDELLKLEKDLAANPTDTQKWIEAASIKKFFNDLTGTRDIWEYIIELNPRNTTILINLGNLYAMYLSNYLLAEKYYKQAITAEPALVPAILALADLYKTFYKEKYPEVPIVIQAGLKVVPDDANLMIFLATYYKESGDLAKAIEYYERSLLVQPDNQPVVEEARKIKAALEPVPAAN